MTEAILAYGYDLGTIAKPIWKDQQYPEWFLIAEDEDADITHVAEEVLRMNLDMGKEFSPAVQEWRSLRMARECVEVVPHGWGSEMKYLLVWNRTFTAEPGRTWRLESADLAGMSAATGALMWAVEALGLNRYAMGLGFPTWHLACYKD